MSLGSTSTSNTGPDTAASKPDALKAAHGCSEEPESSAERDEPKEGETESKVDDSSNDDDGVITKESLECPSDRTQSDEEELWMGPWNSLHIPMTKL